MPKPPGVAPIMPTPSKLGNSEIGSPYKSKLINSMHTPWLNKHMVSRSPWD